MTGGADGRSLSSIVGGGRAHSAEALAEAMPGREGVVRARLSQLLASLGDLPASHPALAFDRGPGFGRLLDEICPVGSVVMHSRRVPNKALSLDHLAIVPRGLVVVGSDLAAASRSGLGHGGAPWQVRENIGAWARQGAPWTGPTPRRAGIVRELLRGGYALNSWLGQTAWAEVPVFVAACSAPVLGPTQKAPLVLEGMTLDGLWLGAVNQLPDWMASGGSLDTVAGAELGQFLATELPVG
jgi:hypothetical protein